MLSKRYLTVGMDQSTLQYIEMTRAEFQVFEGEPSHPDPLNHDDPESIQQVLECIHLNRLEEIHSRIDPLQRLHGQGGVAHIGFDAEWCQSHSHLKTLSYQFFLCGEGGDMSAIFFPPSGELEDRLALKDMLAAVIAKGLESGCLLDCPARVVLVGFFLRADLAMLSDLVQFKTDLGNVGGKIATTRRPVDFEIRYRQTDLSRTGCQLEVAYA